MKSLLSLLVFVVACGGSSAKPAPAPAPTEAAKSGLETSPATACTRDDECYCRVFDGAQFGSGREPSKCCTDAGGCNDLMGGKVEQAHCMGCFYD